MIANCATCGRGSFCPGGSEKHLCPENQTTLLENASSTEECVCDEGRFATPDGCEFCAAGSYKSEAGNHSCEPRRIGTWSNWTVLENNFQVFVGCVSRGLQQFVTFAGPPLLAVFLEDYKKW